MFPFIDLKARSREKKFYKIEKRRKGENSLSALKNVKRAGR